MNDNTNAAVQKSIQYSCNIYKSHWTEFPLEIMNKKIKRENVFKRLTANAYTVAKPACLGCSLNHLAEWRGNNRRVFDTSKCLVVVPTWIKYSIKQLYLSMILVTFRSKTQNLSTAKSNVDLGWLVFISVSSWNFFMFLIHQSNLSEMQCWVMVSNGMMGVSLSWGPPFPEMLAADKLSVS